MTTIRPINFTLCPPSICPSTKAAAPTVEPITMSKVAEWLGNFNTKFPRFEMIAQNGLASLLLDKDKKIDELKEFEQMHQLGNRCLTADFITPIVNQSVYALVKPKIDELGKALEMAKKRVSDKEALEKDKDLQKKWEKFNLPASVIEKHADCARFLLESKLLFAIVGFRETRNEPEVHNVKLDPIDGHPMIKVQGSYKRWEQIKRELVYDPETYQIRSRDYPGSIVQNWTYLSPQGLVPIDRLNHEQLVPIYQLTQEERRAVVSNAQKFYQKNQEIDVGVAKDWVVQFHTSPRRQCVFSLPPFPDHPLLTNLVKNLNTHIVMRLIGPNGDVYSFGIEMPAESQEFLWENNMAKAFSTVTAKVNKAGDYEEFMPHSGRMVTGIPLTAQRADNILQLMNNLGDVRFNFLRQNCSNLMSIVLKSSGYDLDTLTTIPDTLWDIIPSLKHIPVIGGPLDKINCCFKKIGDGICRIVPRPIQTAVSFGKDALLYIPRKIATVFFNIVILNLGGGKMLHPLQKGVEEDDFYKANRFLNFSRVIRSWTDLFKDQTSEVYHSKYFLDWQKEQGSTFTAPWTGKPRLAIVPPVA